MAQIIYTQRYPRDVGGIKGSAILQTRGGNDEPISPVALWELDSSTGLYMPPGVSTSPTLPRVIAKRKIEVAVNSYVLTLNVVGSGGIQTFSTIPPAGVIWRIQLCSIYTLAVSGASSGGHSILIGQKEYGGPHTICVIDKFYDQKLSNYDIKEAYAHANAPVRGTVISNTVPLLISYINNTDVTNTGDIILTLAREVEYVA